MVLGIVVFPKACRRLYVRLPAVERDNWGQVLASKNADLSEPWRDGRPLIIIAGDSHAEMGEWYNCFQGAFAVRNCGLSRAKIEDVTTLVQAIADTNPKAVILMCGFNNLSREDSVESCIDLYQKLLWTVQSKLRPEKIMVLSVTPLRATALDRAALTINRKIARFNQRLEQLCQPAGAVFVDVTPSLADAGGGLAASLTTDGLHLNQAGYARLASVLWPYLPQTR